MARKYILDTNIYIVTQSGILKTKMRLESFSKRNTPMTFMSAVVMRGHLRAGASPMHSHAPSRTEFLVCSNVATV